MNDMSAAPVAECARVGARDLKRWLKDGGEIAVLDVREHGQYGEGHLFFAVSTPYSRLEPEVCRLVPRRSTRVVVYDSGDDGVADRAARRLAALGYSRVFVLEGGTKGWTEAGFQLFAGVNVPSKTFGELAELVFHTPRINARDLSRRLANGDKLVVLDGRPVEEYRKMSIPTAICCPNGELALRAGLLAPDPDITIVVNCAGRTRSIVGAQTLIDMGVANQVFALENGTQGWYLEDLPLSYGADRLYPPPPPASELPRLRERARALAKAWEVPMVSASEVEAFLADAAATTYLCDVRTPQEFAGGTLPGARSTPGGQLIQATDQYLGTRLARVVLFDGEGVRAPVIAARLRQMGWNACVLSEGVSARLAPHEEMVRAARPLPTVPAGDIASMLPDATMLDIRSSTAYRAEHLRGSVWTIRPRLGTLALDTSKPVLLIADNVEVAQLAALELMERHVADVRLHLADPVGWAVMGLATEATPDCPADADCIDFLFFVHDRHSGNKAAARQYLAWETNLIAQIDADERASFRI